VIKPGAKEVGVTVPDNRYVPIGTILNTQEAADKLPKITNDYPLKLNRPYISRIEIDFLSVFQVFTK
jgi:hypothetical protein